MKHQAPSWIFVKCSLSNVKGSRRGSAEAVHNMKLWIISSITFFALLIFSNLWWFYVLLDSGVSYTYLKQSYEEHKEAMEQSMALLPVVAKPRYSREEVLAAAREKSGPAEPIVFEKEGYVWIGSIGIKFDESGAVLDVKPNWDTSSEENP